jgi:hypothetical protein
MNRKIRAITATGVMMSLSLAAVSGCAGKSTAGSADHVPLTPVGVVQAALLASAADNSVHVTENLSGNGTVAQMSGTQQLSPPKVDESLTMDIGGASTLKATEIYDGTNFYLGAPQLSTVDGGKPWARIEPSSASGAGHSIESLLDSARDQAPSSTLVPLLASKDLKSLGAATVEGTRATGYSGTLSAAQLNSISPAGDLTADQIKQLKQSFQQDSVSTETVEVWIDSENLPLRVTQAVTTALGTADTAIDYADWGAPVTITDPPGNEVGTLNSSAL